jgi:hypothetical protein
LCKCGEPAVLIGDEFVLPFLKMGRGLLGDPFGELGKKMGFAGMGGSGGLRRVSVGGGDFSLILGGNEGGLQFSVLLYKL